MNKGIIFKMETFYKYASSYEYIDNSKAGTSAEMPDYSSTDEDITDTEPVQLQPFIHQVGGHSCVLRFNETTLCKPLITREHLFYESLPMELKAFIPVYRGIIEVELQEGNDGQITLIGHPVQSDSSGGQGSSSQRSSPRVSPKQFERTNSPLSSGSENDNSQSPVLPSRKKHSRVAGKSYSVKLLRSGSIEVSTQTDTVFHSPDPKSGPKSANLNPWSLKCHKRQLAKMRMDNKDSNLKKFILLENVAAKFKYPCILDLKMGTRQHGDDAPESKKNSQMRKCATTTSSAVGLRLIGMQVYQSTSGQFVCQNKYFGRKLTVPEFKESLELFLYDGEKMRLELVDPILNRLQHLYKIVKKQESFRFYSSSLLIMYGGREGIPDIDIEQDRPDDKESVNSVVDSETQVNSDELNVPTQDDNCLVDVRMIDFAHSTHRGFSDDAPHKGIDDGYLFGLQNLITIFEGIKQRYSGHTEEDNG
ncbi:inositol hexakisphosphate kinase 1-like isoform X2 [Mercenaria mercenaria]|uniref:inositol hexakisphosphate kinase 1-like isoform X2 n=1 Tax=Mercenaria mercenaria TaxID=6596 RepID=UPI001E1DB6A1|nr:inositol hexakisphosphate kinase 1-like isoform X2 [Mercenaria mercenaria]